jgi:hypothetical protein
MAEFVKQFGWPPLTISQLLGLVLTIVFLAIGSSPLFGIDATRAPEPGREAGG